MPLEGEYVPSASDWVREQIDAYEASGGTRAATYADTGRPIVVVTMRGNKSGKIRKIALMRVEYNGEYALLASKGGAPVHPVWYYNLIAHPELITIQDGAELHDYSVREVAGVERDEWWKRAVIAHSRYAESQEKTSRLIPVFVATPLH